MDSPLIMPTCRRRRNASPGALDWFFMLDANREYHSVETHEKRPE